MIIIINRTITGIISTTITEIISTIITTHTLLHAALIITATQEEAVVRESMVVVHAQGRKSLFF